MSETKTIWTENALGTLYDKPILDLLLEAQLKHRQYFKANTVQLSQLYNIKEGACPEDCAFCSQSGHFKTHVKKAPMPEIEAVVMAARAAKEGGATRFCMGAAWRSPPKKMIPKMVEMIKAVKAEGLETCMTLGLLDEQDATALGEAGLDYYNHNIESSPEFYEKIVTTHKFSDRIDTLCHVQKADIKVCSGGILGMGESKKDRIRFIMTLANLPKTPESVPLNLLVPHKGTPLEKQVNFDPMELVRTIAVTRLAIPGAVIRLSAGRKQMLQLTEPLHALCFMAGANSIFYGEKLLTSANNAKQDDDALLAALGITPIKENAMLRETPLAASV